MVLTELLTVIGSLECLWSDSDKPPALRFAYRAYLVIFVYYKMKYGKCLINSTSTNNKVGVQHLCLLYPILDISVHPCLVRSETSRDDPPGRLHQGFHLAVYCFPEMSIHQGRFFFKASKEDQRLSAS